MAEKKELTIKQKRNRYRTAQYSLIAGEYVSALTPYGVMAIVNREEWFVYNPDSWKVGLGGTIGLTLVALAMFLLTKRRDNEKLTDGMIALAKYAGLTVIDCTTGGYPEGVDIKTWIHSQNYDDTVLIASKICFEEDKQNLETLPKLSRENRSKIIY